MRERVFSARGIAARFATDETGTTTRCCCDTVVCRVFFSVFARRPLARWSIFTAARRDGAVRADAMRRARAPDIRIGRWRRLRAAASVLTLPS